MRWFWVIAGVLLSILAALQITAAIGESPTFDESLHLASGYAYIKAGDYRFGPEQPPLAKILFAAPLLVLGAAPPSLGPSTTALTLGTGPLPQEFGVGYDFLYHNAVGPDALLLAGRGVAICLTLAFGILLTWWTRRRFGPAAALAALALFCLDPNVIAHGHYITTDLPLAFAFFASCITWAEYLASGRGIHLVLAAASFGAAQVTKFSALLLIPSLALLYAIRWRQAPSDFTLRRAVRDSALLLAAWSAAVAISYGPETIRLFSHATPRLTAQVDRGSLFGRALYHAGARLDLPEHAYPVGLSQLTGHDHAGHPTYLLGKHSVLGWWYFFPVILAVKSTMAVLAALLLALGVAAIAAARSFGRGKKREPFLWAVSLPPLIYFAVSMTSHINLGVRHILLVYPFIHVAAAGVLARVPRKRIAVSLMAAIVLLQAAECASIFPYYTAFFNALSGGPGNAPHYVLDSSLDWGQDAKRLAAYLHERGASDASIEYVGTADLHHYGLDSKPLPHDAVQPEPHGYAAASVTALYGAYQPESWLAWLRKKTPVARIGYSIYVYDLGRNR